MTVLFFDLSDSVPSFYFFGLGAFEGLVWVDGWMEFFWDGICASLLFSHFLPSLWMNPSAVGTTKTIDRLGPGCGMDLTTRIDALFPSL